MCYPVLDGAYKRTLAAKLERIAHVAAAAFFSEWSTICPMPYSCK